MKEAQCHLLSLEGRLLRRVSKKKGLSRGQETLNPTGFRTKLFRRFEGYQIYSQVSSIAFGMTPMSIIFQIISKKKCNRGELCILMIFKQINFNYIIRVLLKIHSNFLYWKETKVYQRFTFLLALKATTCKK